jgi:hypothetical protein
MGRDLNTAQLGAGRARPAPQYNTHAPHHVELVQAQSIDACPLTVYGLPEGLQEQVSCRKRAQLTLELWGDDMEEHSEPQEGGHRKQHSQEVPSGVSQTVLI